MTFENVNPIAWLRSRQGLYFPGGRIDPGQLVAGLISDLVELGGGDCRVRRRDDWWFVASNIDWLRDETRTIRDHFFQVVPAPQHGEHSIRAEILLTAFADDVWTIAEEDEISIKGEAPSRELVGSARESGWARRVVAFRLRPLSSSG